MSLNTFTLRRKAKMGVVSAQKILPLREQGNLLLSTLLLGNVAVNAAISIILGSITAGVIAGLTATGLIVVFGEIIPQALFARHSLKYGAKFTWLVWIFLIAMYPVTKPIALALDYALGGETPNAFSKREMALLVDEQQKLAHSEIDKDDYRLIKNSLDFSERTVRSVMTPMKNAFFLNKNTFLNIQTRKLIGKSGHSRIPVFSGKKKNVIGILFTKDIIRLDRDKKFLVGDVARPRVEIIQASTKLDDTLRLFQKWRIHLSLVKDSEDELVGIVTLEDVLEEIIGEVVDEHDQFVDMREPEEKL